MTKWWLLLAVSVSASAADYDLIIRNGRVVDGTGNPWFRADVAIRGDRIVAIAPRISGRAGREIQARGQVVAPGFIDLHTHARRGIFQNPAAENYVRQGVTTIFEGPDGGSPLPIAEFLEKLEAADTVPNVATFVGQGAIREAVIGDVDRRATAAELEKMRALVRQAMLDGAFGLSTGLYYVPGTFTPTEEVIELARVAGEMGGIHISHMRNEAAGVLDSVRETIRIGEEGRLPTQVTHAKVMGVPNRGKGPEVLRLVNEARARGVDASMDQYPYTASSTSLQAALLPAWALEGGREAMLKRLGDPSLRPKIHSEIVQRIMTERGGGDPRNVQIASAAADPSINGMNLAQIMAARGIQPTVTNAAELTMTLLQAGSVSGIFHAISEPDLELILQHPSTMIASDGEVPTFGKASPHPRSYGTYPRVIAKYVREKKLLTLEDAIRKMTSLPAQRVGLADRGVLRPGMKADVVIFDPASFRDRATFEQPHQYAEGLAAVIINGEIVFADGRMTGARPGVVLRGPATGVAPASRRQSRRRPAAAARAGRRRHCRPEAGATLTARGFS